MRESYFPILNQLKYEIWLRNIFIYNYRSMKIHNVYIYIYYNIKVLILYNYYNA